MLAACGVQALAQTAPEITAPAEEVTVAASRMLAPELLAGNGYRVHPEVTVFRARAFYTLEYETGTDVVVGTRYLLERIDEIHAVETLAAMKKTSVYGDALKNSAKAPLQFGKDLVTSPVSTLGKVGRGIGSFFSDVGYSIVSDDPNQENVAKTALGFATAKRMFAYELGVNPYTTFKPLEDELNEVAWTAVGGGLTASVGFRAVGGTPGTVLTASKTANGMKKLVRDHSPRKLQNINFEKLEAMDIGEDLAEALLNNFNYDPEAETRLVGALASMEGVSGRETFVKRAVLADTVANARLVRDWAELFAAYHSEIQAVAAVIVAQSAPILIVGENTAFGLFPADYVTPAPGFMARLSALAQDLKASGYVLGDLWTTGVLDPDMEAPLLGLGWRKARGGVEDVLFVADEAAQ